MIELAFMLVFLIPYLFGAGLLGLSIGLHSAEWIVSVIYQGRLGRWLATGLRFLVGVGAGALGTWAGWKIFFWGIDFENRVFTFFGGHVAWAWAFALGQIVLAIALSWWTARLRKRAGK